MYVQDNWRWKPNFTVRAGLKWEYYSPLQRGRQPGFLPVLTSGQSLDQVMLDPPRQSRFVERRLLQQGSEQLRADPRLRLGSHSRTASTAVRGGYSLTFVNEETVTVGRSAVARRTPGLSQRRHAAATSSRAAGCRGTGHRDAGVPVDAHAGRPDGAQRDVGHPWGSIQSINAAARAPGQRSASSARSCGRWPSRRATWVAFGRGIWRGTDYNQVHGSAPWESLRSGLQPRAVERVPGAAGGTRLQPRVQRHVPGSQCRSRCSRASASSG